MYGGGRKNRFPAMVMPGKAVSKIGGADVEIK
jgi:hypothetical protein